MNPDITHHAGGYRQQEIKEDGAEAGRWVEQLLHAHDHDGHFAPMQNLPERLKGRRYYKPSDQGREREIGERLKKWRGEGEPSD